MKERKINGRVMLNMRKSVWKL